MRPTKLQNYMDIAITVSQRSHDAETKVGAILFKNETGAIVAQAFNGFVRGANDKTLPNTRPDKYKYMIHAETNLTANCAKHGISMENTTVVCTLTPCAQCMRLLFQCGITEVICKEKYKDFDEILKMQDLSIDLEQTTEGFIKLTYKIK